MQKWTLAYIYTYIWYELVWRAYKTQFSRAYDTKFVGMHMICSFRVHMIRIYPTTLILPIASIYKPKSIFAYQHHEFSCLFGVAYYLYALLWDRVGSQQGYS